jgi:hypothetical protein
MTDRLIDRLVDRLVDRLMIDSLMTGRPTISPPPRQLPLAPSSIMQPPVPLFRLPGC